MTYLFTSPTGEDIPGDLNPKNFSWLQKLTSKDLQTLYIRNAMMQLAIDWTTAEALRQGITFDQDQPVTGLKFGKAYTWKTFMDWFKWIGGLIKTKEALAWSELYGISQCILWDEQKGTQNAVYTKKGTRETINLSDGLYYKKNSTGIYTDFTVFYPLTDGVGFEVMDSDDDGKPLLVRLTIPQENKSTARKKIYVDGDRIVEFIAPRKKIAHEGTPKEGLAIMALAQEQMLRALVERAKTMAGGYKLVKGEVNENNKEALMAKVNTLNYNDAILMSTEGSLEVITPDLKASGEFMSLMQMVTWEFARHTRIAEKLINGESQGIQSSAKYDILSTYTVIYELQTHYQKPLEELFFKLGKINTDFIWNEIVPEMEELQPDFKIGVDGLNEGKAKEDNNNKQDEAKKDGEERQRTEQKV